MRPKRSLLSCEARCAAGIRNRREVTACDARLARDPRRLRAASGCRSSALVVRHLGRYRPRAEARSRVRALLFQAGPARPSRPSRAAPKSAIVTGPEGESLALARADPPRPHLRPAARRPRPHSWSATRSIRCPRAASQEQLERGRGRRPAAAREARASTPPRPTSTWATWSCCRSCASFRTPATRWS